MKPLTKRILLAASLAALLLFAFWFGGNAPGLRGWSPGFETPPSVSDSSDMSENEEQQSAGADSATEPPNPSPEEAPATVAALNPETTATIPAPAAPKQQSASPAPAQDNYKTDPVPVGKPQPVEPQSVAVGDTAYSCTLSISCNTILDNMGFLSEGKAELVPDDGILFPPTKVTFYEGESVFNVLQREAKKAKLHMEFVNTPIYNSAYIEGIGNLYEFDCGERSGWMYKVNGWFPNYGSSRYQLRDGDAVDWVFTCSLGADVGGEGSARNGA